MSQTTQMEAGDSECPTCKGRGELYVQTCGHQGNCPCDEGDPVECPDCCDDDDSDEDGPMGGMGYQHDYSDSLASGRALKD